MRNFTKQVVAIGTMSLVAVSMTAGGTGIAASKSEDTYRYYGDKKECVKVTFRDGIPHAIWLRGVSPLESISGARLHPVAAKPGWYEVQPQTENRSYARFKPRKGSFQYYYTSGGMGPAYGTDSEWAITAAEYKRYGCPAYVKAG